jgi:hypothetical protein
MSSFAVDAACSNQSANLCYESGSTRVCARGEGPASENNCERDQIVYACDKHEQHRPNPARQNPRAAFRSPDFFIPASRRSRRTDGRGDRAVKHHLSCDEWHARIRRRRPRKSETDSKPNSEEKNQEKDRSFCQRGPPQEDDFLSPPSADGKVARPVMVA